MQPYDYKVVQECRRMLEEIGAIADVWCVDDVKSLNPRLTNEQAWQILQTVDEDVDATRGINWDTIEAAMASLGYQVINQPGSPEWEQIIFG